jgi:hypothetical protein
VLEGGFEPDGWLRWDEHRSGVTPQGCIGGCRCRTWPYWLCRDDSFRVDFALTADYQPVAAEEVSTWLAKAPPLLLMRRRR